MASASRNNIDLLLLDLIHFPSTHSGTKYHWQNHYLPDEDVRKQGFNQPQILHFHMLCVCVCERERERDMQAW